MNGKSSSKEISCTADGVSIKGVMKTSMIDYKENIVSTIFFSRCNFRCGFCHNPELVFDEIEQDVPVVELLDFLKEKKPWIDGVCLTGGEPMVHKGLPEFARKVKALGLKVKIDTNGSNPAMLKKMIAEGLVDQVAMDIKASFDRYEEVCATKVNIDNIKESITLLLAGDTDAYFRTTVLPRFYDAEEAHKIGAMIKGAKRYVIQQFRSSDKTLDPIFANEKSFLGNEIAEFAKIMETYVDNVEIRGID